MSEEAPTEPEEPPEPGMVLAAGVVIYGAMAGAALLWLWLRDRVDVLAERSIGEHGVLACSGRWQRISTSRSFVK